jgi:hypothetical protein
MKTTNNNFALVLIIAVTGKQSYYKGQCMYLFTQHLYVVNNTDKTLIRCLLIFLFSTGNCHFNDI